MPSFAFKRVPRQLVVVYVTAMSLLLASAPLRAQTAEPVYSVQAQAMSSALLVLGQQAGVSILVDQALVDDLQAPAVAAATTLREALDQLLADSPLQARIDGDVVVVTPRAVRQQEEAPTQPNAARLLPRIVVSAAGFEQNMFHAPASISVITPEDLEKRPITDVTDVIREIPGASLTNGEGRNVDISLRGMPAGYTLILIDGKRENLTGIARKGNNNVKQSFLPPSSAIERIEVIRGPMSTIYGSDAMGGVINIITKKSADAWQGEITTDYLAQEESRFGDARGSSFFLNGPILGEKLGLQLAGRHQLREEDDVPRGEPRRTNRNLTGRIWINPSENQNIMIERSQEYFEMYAMVAGRSPGTLWNQDTRRNAWSVSHQGYWGFGNTSVAFQKEDARKGTIEADNWTLDAKAVLPWQGVGQHTTTVGAQLTSNEVNSWDITVVTGEVIDVIEQKNKAVFVEDEWQFKSNMALTAGVRFDNPDDFASHVSPRGYLVWDVTDKLILKSGVATGFIAPRADYVAPGLVTESEDTTSGVYSYTYANPDLEPETSINYEVSAIWQQDNGGYISLTVFQTDYKDKLSSFSYEVVDELAPYDQVGNLDPSGYCADAVGAYGCSWSERVNIDEAESRGIELISETPLFSGVALKTSYTFLQSEQQTGPNKGSPLSGSPKHKAVGTLDWTLNAKLSTWLSYSYRSRLRASNRPSPGCFDDDSCPSLSMVDLGGTVKVNDDLRFNLGVYNLLNRKWWDYDLRGSVEDGRRYYMRATYQF